MSNSENQGNSNAWTPPQAVAKSGNEDGMDLHELISVLRGGKWIIAAITAVVLALFLLYAFLAQPVYEADALIQIKQGSESSVLSSDILSALLPPTAVAETEIEIMSSRSVLQPTVDNEHLNIKIDGGELPIIGRFLGESTRVKLTVTHLQVPSDWMDESLTLTAKGHGTYVLESPSGKKVLQGLVGQPASNQDGSVKILVKDLHAPAGKSFTLTRIYDQEAVSALQKSLQISEQGKGTGIVQISLEGASPVQIRSIVNSVANNYLHQNVTAMATQAQQSLVFINKQLPKLKSQLDTAEAKLTAFKTKNGAVDLNKQAEVMLQQMTTLESQLTQLSLAEASMRQRYTARYPGVQALQGQERDIQDKLNTIQAQIQRLPEQEQDYLGLMRDVQVYQQLYTTLLSKVQDLQIAEAGTTGSARIVDYAVTPVMPIAPRKGTIAMLGLLLGLILGLLFVFLRSALSRTVQDPTELEREFGLPVYAVVPHSARQEYFIKTAKRDATGKIPVLAVDDPRDPTVESIRSLRTSINFALQGASRKVISLGGCAPGVGKSFLSVNLAHVLGMGGARVLLIDADMRRGHLEKYMNGRKEPGLSEILAEKISPEEVIRSSPYNKNVDFIPSGTFPPNPYELLTKPSLESLIISASDTYDLVVFDVPPVLAVAEGLIISRFSTANFLIVKAADQTLRELHLAVDRMRQNGIQPNGFVFNNLTRRLASYTYGRRAKAYYYSRYDEHGKK